MQEEFLTVRDVAKVLKVQKRTIQRLMKSKKLPGIKVGKEWRIRSMDLAGWIQRMKT
jgi:excisionase family DNA binding protein